MGLLKSSLIFITRAAGNSPKILAFPSGNGNTVESSRSLFMKFDSRRAYGLVLAILFTAYAPIYAAEEKKAEGTKFLRFVEDGKTGGSLEVAVATYKNDKGVTVQLIGAVHIAD